MNYSIYIQDGSGWSYYRDFGKLAEWHNDSHYKNLSYRAYVTKRETERMITYTLHINTNCYYNRTREQILNMMDNFFACGEGGTCLKVEPYRTERRYTTVYKVVYKP